MGIHGRTRQQLIDTINEWQEEVKETTWQINNDPLFNFPNIIFVRDAKIEGIKNMKESLANGEYDKG